MIKELVKSRSWKYLILQAQKISSSGRFNYSRAEGIDLAAFAANRGIDTYFYSEWGLLGVANDGNRVESIYRAMADASGAEVLCVGRAWDIALSKNPTMKLHAGDGNHQNEVGAFLSASVIAASLTGKPAKALESFDYPMLPRRTSKSCSQLVIRCWRISRSSDANVTKQARNQRHRNQPEASRSNDPFSACRLAAGSSTYRVLVCLPGTGLGDGTGVVSDCHYPQIEAVCSPRDSKLISWLEHEVLIPAS